jgi:hypothetical protein
MPVTRTRQDWSVGSTVRVGFLQLRITGLVPTPGDGEPDIYQLVSLAPDRYGELARYEFQPHLGLYRTN